MPGFTLKGKIQLDGSQWQAGLNQAKQRANRWSNEVAGIVKGRLAAAFGMYGIGRALGGSILKAGEVRDRSTMLGIDPETYQQIDFAAAQSGSSIDDAAKAIKRLSVASLDALRGSKDIQEAFGRFGLSMEHVAKLKADPASMLFMIAELVEKGVNPTALADLQKILGRSGANLLPAFEAGFGKTAQSAKELGVVISKEEIMRLGAASDEWETLTRRFSRGVAGVASVGAQLREDKEIEAMKTVFNALIERESRDRENARRVAERMTTSIEEIGAIIKGSIF
jgi:hypothetical protein